MLSVGAASTAIKEILSFSAPGTAFPATVNPMTVYNQLTGVFGTGSTVAAPAAPAGSTGQAAYLVKRKQSVIDLVQGRPRAVPVAEDEQDRPAAVKDWMDLLRDRPETRRRRADDAHVVQQDDGGGGAASPRDVGERHGRSPTGKITLGSVLGNTPERRGRQEPRHVVHARAATCC